MESPPADSYLIEPLATHHNRVDFRCGIEELDQYLRRNAKQDAKRRVSAPFVVVERGYDRIAGFCTLSATTINLGELPADIAKKLPKYPLVPATLLGRLAVDQRYRGHGLGELLLIDALHRSWRQSEQIASTSVVVEAKNEPARQFYLRYDFLSFPTQDRRLFLPMKTLDRLFRDE